ncbi:MAG: metallophosphoesterase [Eggerthellaceae bacterium]|jgi:hypothetical protein
MTTFLTGDPHGHFGRIVRFADANALTADDTIVILGDASINYEGRDSEHDRALREQLAPLECTIFCIHGNHDARPYTLDCYRKDLWHGGITYIEDAYPNIRFAEDGEVYDFDGTKALVCGGAYSVDAPRRRREHLLWYPDEQPDDQVKAKVEAQLAERGWDIDVMLTHTCPYKYRPIEMMAKGIDQSAVDTSTERWLDTVEDRLVYRQWYCGHWHTDKRDGKVLFMFEDWTVMWPGDPDFEALRAEEAASPNRRSVHQAAVDLCVSERLLREHLPLDPAMVRRSDGAQLIDEATVEDFVNNWFIPPNMRDFQYRWCSDCGRWFHRSHMTRVPSTDNRGYGFLYCPECGPAHGAERYEMGV